MTIKFTSLIAVLAGLLLLTDIHARAEENSQYLLSSKAYEVITEARSLMEKKDYGQAETGLAGLLGTDITDYDRAVAQQTLGYVYVELDRLDQAINAFIKSLEGNALPAEVSHNISFVLAQLLANKGQYKESLNYLNEWLAMEANPEPQAHLFAASVYYQLEDYRSMIPHAQQAIAKSSKPEQSWYEMLLAGYFQINDYSNAAALLEQMIVHYPDNTTYWKQLAGSYQLSKQYNKSLAVYEIALQKNILDEKEIIQFAQLYVVQEVPYKSGTLLSEMLAQNRIQRSDEHLQLLANSWLLAKEYERAAEVLTELAQRKQDPDLYYQIGQIHFEDEKWPEAIASLELAVKEGKGRHLAEAWLLLGIAAFHNKETEKSSKALQQAVNFKNTKSQAEWWLGKLNDRASTSNS